MHDNDRRDDRYGPRASRFVRVPISKHVTVLISEEMLTAQCVNDLNHYADLAWEAEEYDKADEISAREAEIAQNGLPVEDVARFPATVRFVAKNYDHIRKCTEAIYYQTEVLVQDAAAYLLGLEDDDEDEE